MLSARVFRDKMTGMSKGYGFVSYDNPQTAAATIQQMDGFVIGNKRLNVRIKKGEPGGEGGPPAVGGAAPNRAAQGVRYTPY